ncbi:unnamed protein product, partial [Prorocentrum cordatum]
GGAADEALADLDDMFADSGPPPPSAEKPSLLASTLACTAAPAVGDTELSCTADSGTWAEATEATQPELEKRGALAEFRPPERGLGEEAACGEAGGPQASLLGGAPAKASEGSRPESEHDGLTPYEPPVHRGEPQPAEGRAAATGEDAGGKPLAAAGLLEGECSTRAPGPPEGAQSPRRRVAEEEPEQEARRAPPAEA